MKRAVFLDRDNTLIANDGDLGDPEQVQLLKAAALGVAALRGLGYQVVVVTNQGGVARGRYSEDDVNAVHDRINDHLQSQANGAKIDRFYFCPFHPEGSVQRYRKEHPWRKPAPGMLLQAAEDMKLDMSLCWMIGDQPRDIEAGKAAGVRTIQIAAKTDQADLPLDPNQSPDFSAMNLIEAARIIAQQIRPEAGALGGQSSEAQQPTERKPAPPKSPRTTFPATQALDPTRPSSKKSSPTSRPFKPWSIQPVSNTDANAGEPAASTLRMTQPEAPTPDPPRDAQQHEAPPPVMRIDRGRSTPVTDEADTADEDTAPSTPGRTDHLLSQILREIKTARAHDADWTAMKTAAVGVFQPLAAFCGLMALLNTDQPGVLTNWLLGAVFGQLIVLTLLLLHWQK